jgi:cell division protease FtsH
MGGRVAEETFFDRLSTGAANDIERATQIARRMVCDYGMSEKLGPLSFGQGEHEIFLGRDFSQRRDFSEDTARLIDAEVHAIIMRNFERAKSIIREKREILVGLAEALLVRETLDSCDVVRLMNGEVLPPKPPPAAAEPSGTKPSPPDPGLKPALSPA